MMMLFRSFAFAAVVLAALPVGAAAANAATYGLAIGVDDYGGDNLQGAVADAEAIAGGLDDAGAAKVESLTGKDAKLPSVRSAWTALLDGANYGDVIVLSFAGKGDLGEDGPQYLFGDGSALTRKAVLEWAQDAEDKGVKLLFIGDASFGGTLERTYPKDLVRLRQSEETKRESASSATRPENGFSKAVFAYGSGCDKAVPELRIGDAVRGGLSWAFVQALSGAAEEDSDGQLSDHELAVYLPLVVGALTEGQQEVEVLPRRSQPLTLFPVARPSPETPPADMPLRLAVVGGEAAVIGDFPDVEIVEDPKEAELIWSVADETLTHRIGGVVASGVDAEGLGNELAKWSALNWLVARSAQGPVPLDLVSGPGRLPQGARAQVEILPGRYPMITVFDLGPAGNVVPIMPADGEAADKPQNRRHIHQMFQVSNGPGGAIHRVVIFSETPLTGLHDALEGMQKSGKTETLRSALQDALPSEAKVQIGILPIYTGASADSDSK
ncbi:Caspase domain protein [Methyloligella halotolerans]|uniref:Caspase domain protein n=1 Tax=Methyloligella halotolerans TaxID=1177755 RepID=A0A1E2RWZ5_9HYPH|nr:caspase family protein [Methyloligella halotolerans]ODA66786.1 Caspase domain protein [Methyloligella halotolerans]